jgi:hypothetical protein
MKEEMREGIFIRYLYYSLTVLRLCGTNATSKGRFKNTLQLDAHLKWIFKAGGVAEMVAQVSSKHKALSSNPKSAKKEISKLSGFSNQ